MKLKKMVVGLSIVGLLCFLIPVSVMAEAIPEVSYRTHIENVGWQDWKNNGDTSGTSAQSLRLEGIEINVNQPDANLGIAYETHVENIGWQGLRFDGNTSGTHGQALRLEAVRIGLTGSDAHKYDVYYQVHAQDYGWLDWAKNGYNAGTAGLALRLEAINIVIVPKDASAPGSTNRPFVKKEYSDQPWDGTLVGDESDNTGWENGGWGTNN